MAYIFTAITGGQNVGQAFTRVNQNLQSIEDNFPTGGTVSGDYLPLSGGTVTGPTTFIDFATPNNDFVQISGGSITFNNQDEQGSTKIINQVSGQSNTVILPRINGNLALISDITASTENRFVPLSGTASGSPITGDIVITNSNNLRLEDGSDVSSLELNINSIDFRDDYNSVKTRLQYSPQVQAESLINIFDTLNDGYMVIAPNPSGQNNKVVVVNTSENGWDYVDNSTFFNAINIDYINAQVRQQDNSNTYSDLEPFKWYKITNRPIDEELAPNTVGDLFLMAISPNRFSPDGYLNQINADYQNVGAYDDVTSFVTNYGVAYQGLEVGDMSNLDGNVIIWNNRHWLCNMNGIQIYEDTDIINNFTPLDKDGSLYGYVNQIVKVFFQFNNDASYDFTRIEDFRGNIVKHSSGNTVDNIQTFRFGFSGVANNYIDSYAKCNIINYQDIIFKDNHIIRGEIASATNLPNLPYQVQISYTNLSLNDYSFVTPSPSSSFNLTEIIAIDKKCLTPQSKVYTITSNTFDFNASNLNRGFVYEIVINATGGTFNGVIDNSINNIRPSEGIYLIRNSTPNPITFQNVNNIFYLEGQIDAVIGGGSQSDSIEFRKSFGSSSYFQTNINNYINS